ncbi:MAG: hypothetical protein H5U20_02935 [Rhodobacteraceae bacterium]|nr:hypothetical protein [Paracoccaceae bacterium]
MGAFDDPAAALAAADLAMVAGVLLAGLALPAAISAWIDARGPWLATALSVLAAVLIVTAAFLHPGAYSWREVPMAFVRMVAWVVN